MLKLRLQEEYRQRTTANLAMQALSHGGDVISFLVAQGAGEATDILLIDESLCVRCDNCEKACAETHNGTSPPAEGFSRHDPMSLFQPKFWFRTVAAGIAVWLCCQDSPFWRRIRSITSARYSAST